MTRQSRCGPNGADRVVGESDAKGLANAFELFSHDAFPRSSSGRLTTRLCYCHDAKLVYSENYRRRGSRGNGLGKILEALDDVTDRLERITNALEKASVAYALVGGQAVALWVATTDPAAVRTTKNVDILLRREDLPTARAAALSVGMEYFEVMGVGMFLDTADRNPRHAVHLVWAGEKVMADYPLPSPAIDERETVEPGKQVITLAGLARMKLMSNRDQDRVHLRDMIEVGLITREFLAELPSELASRLDALLSELGR